MSEERVIEYEDAVDTLIQVKDQISFLSESVHAYLSNRSVDLDYTGGLSWSFMDIWEKIGAVINGIDIDSSTRRDKEFAEWKATHGFEQPNAAPS